MLVSLPAAGATRYGVLDLQAAQAEDRKLAAILTDALTEALATRTKDDVLSTQELKGLLKAAQDQAVLGCEDPRCALRFSDRLAVDSLLLGRVGTLGDEVVLALTLIDMTRKAVQSRASHRFSRSGMAGRGGGPLKAMNDAVQTLLLPASARAGDQPMSDLVMSLIIEERVEGEQQRLSRVDRCIEDQLQEEDVAFVAADVLANAQGKFTLADALAGKVPATIEDDSVGAVIVARVDVGPAGGYSRSKRVVTMLADLDLRVIRLDTARVVLSKQLTGRANGFSKSQAVNAAAAKACEQVKPALAEALRTRAERGTRVLLELSGERLTEKAPRLAMALEKLPIVGRVRTWKVTATGATLEVTVRGGDGIALFLALPRHRLPLEVLSAEAGRLRAKLN